MPETSIIIRTFNEEKHLGNLLRAIREQDYKDYEIIVIDSGSTDSTLKIAGALADTVLEIKNRDFTFGYSLNTGCRQSLGKYLVFASAHVLPVDSYWLGNLLLPFQDEKVAMVYGRQVGDKNSKFSEKMDFKKISYPNNANSAIRKDLWQKRPFDEYLFGLEDVEWAGHMADDGFKIKYEPKAAIYHIHQEKWPQVFNRFRREAIAAARIGLPSPIQAQPGFLNLAKNLTQDIFCSFPNFSLSHLGEIGRFRYYQWKGTRQGWIHDKNVNLNHERQTLFYPTANRAVLIKNKHQAVIENIPLSEIKPGDILIKIEYVGVCRTDLEVYEGSLGYYKNGLAKYPIIPGHEFSGTIAQIGANNKYQERFRVGETVVGECILSRQSHAERQEVGVINYNGAYSQFIIMPGDHIHKIPDNLDLKIACLAEPLAVVLRALRRVKSRLKGNDNLAVIGAGPIGNFCSQVLSGSGYSVAVFDKNKDRLEILKNKVKAVSQSLANFKNFDVIIEATGSKEILKQILKESKADSTILLLGFPYGLIHYNFEDISGKEKFIAGSVGGDGEDFEEALNLLPQLDTANFTKVVMPLSDFKKAWQMQKAGSNLKTILKP